MYEYGERAVGLDLPDMTVELTFHGAAGVVTGSCIEVSAAGCRLLVDCGLFQGSRTLENLNFEPLPFDPGTIDAVLLTHAHLDHSGRLPLLARAGCTAPIWCTPPTRQLLEPLLMDAARLHAADVERRNERPDRAGLALFEPLYSFDDVAAVSAQARALSHGRWTDLAPGIALRFHDARHILGSASIELNIDGQSLLFSGDIGQDAASHLPPLPAQGSWDDVICESTYGDRDRVVPTIEERRQQLAAEVEQALGRGGNLIIPAFALERTQVILEDMVTLLDAGRLGNATVYVDSPLADRVTRVYRKFARPARGPSPFDHPRVRFTASVAGSKGLNRLNGAIIMAGSGMCNGGRVRHHLLRNLPKAESTLLLVGYQAQGTLGAVLRGGAKAVRISGTNVRVRAAVRVLDCYSAHADRKGLIAWIAGIGPVTGSILLDHGEQPALNALAAAITAQPGSPQTIVPRLGECFALERGKMADRIGKPRPDSARCAAPEDWRNRYAALRASMDDKLHSLPDDAARLAAIAAAEQALNAAAS